eukprot:Polyplicarium_translucidae@DN777_c0_g1_i2.p2
MSHQGPILELYFGSDETPPSLDARVQQSVATWQSIISRNYGALVRDKESVIRNRYLEVDFGQLVSLATPAIPNFQEVFTKTPTEYLQPMRAALHFFLSAQPNDVLLDR